MAIEASLVMLLFVVLLFLLVDFGFLLFMHETIGHRARSALRYGVTHDFDAAAITNLVLHGEAAPPPGAAAIFGLEPAMIAVSRANAGKRNDRIVITIANYRYRFITPGMSGWFTGRPITLTMPMEHP